MVVDNGGNLMWQLIETDEDFTYMYFRITYIVNLYRKNE